MRFSSRKVIAGVAATAALGLVLTGCAGGSEEKATEQDLGTAVAGEVKKDAFKGENFVFAGSGGIFQEAQVAGAWTPFAETSGAVYADDAFDKAKLKAMVEGKAVTWNVVNTTQFDTAANCGTLYEELDYSLIDTSVLPNGGEGLITDKCMVPQLIYGLVVAYNTEAFGGDAPASAADFFDTEKFPGKRSVSAVGGYPEPQMIEFALLADDKDLTKIKTSDIQVALDKYKSLGDNLITWTSGSASQQQLESGEAVMALVWSGRGYGAAAAGAPVAPMWDQWMLEIDSSGVPKGQANPQLANAAINYYLGAKPQTVITEMSSYAPLNSKATPKADAVRDAWLTDSQMDTAVAPQVDFWVEHYGDLETAWESWVTGG